MRSTLHLRISFCLTALVLFLIVPASAQAQSCSISIPNVNFANVDVLPGTAINTASTVNVNCTGLNTNRTYRFCINIGAGTYSTGNQREIQESGATRMDVQLYQDAARTVVWGSWQSGFNPPGVQLDINPPSSNHSFSRPLYARLFANQETAATGSYTSTIPATNRGVLLSVRSNTNRPCNTGNIRSRTSFNITANVIPSCFVNATDLNFGSAGVLNSNVDATSAITAQCSNALPYSVSLDDGSTTGGTTSLRLMTDTVDEVQYQMFSDGARLPADNWGDTPAESVAGTGSGNDQTLTVYGRVPTQSSPAASTYSDMVTVTVTY